MAITVSTVCNVPMAGPDVVTVFAITATARSGDWVVCASNTGDALIRVHLPTGQFFVTKPFADGAQNLSVAAVRPNGNVCLFRRQGIAYEVVPSTGAWTAWTPTGGTPTVPLNLGGADSQVAVVGENAFFGGYGTDTGQPAYLSVLNMATRTWTPLSRSAPGGGTGTSGWFDQSIYDPVGNAIWWFAAVSQPSNSRHVWRLDLNTWTVTQPFLDFWIGISSAAVHGFMWQNYLWVYGYGTGQIHKIDPITQTQVQVTTAPLGFQGGIERPGGGLQGLGGGNARLLTPTGASGATIVSTLNTMSQMYEPDATYLWGTTTPPGGVFSAGLRKVVYEYDSPTDCTYSQTFTPTGNMDTFVVPEHVPGTLRVTLKGGGGARHGTPNGAGGPQGCIRGYLNVAPGTSINVIAGRQGWTRQVATDTPIIGPNFGGQGGLGGNWTGTTIGGDGNTVAGSSGGTASEIRIGGTGLANRVMVAGGGGGGARGGSSGGGPGYSGGLGMADGLGLISGPNIYANGGTLTGPGAAPTPPNGSPPASAGSGGVGGIGANSSVTNGGGGGGGYFGGSGGGAAATPDIGGGGGSSWADTTLVSGIDFVSTTGSGASPGSVLFQWCEPNDYVPPPVVVEAGPDGWRFGHSWG